VPCAGRRALPLGLGCLYRRAHEANLYLGASASAGVLVVHAARGLDAGEELVLSCDAMPRYLEREILQMQARGIAGAIVPRPWPALHAGLTAGAIRWGRSHVHNRGVFAAAAFDVGDIVELCPAIVLDQAADGAFDDFTMEFDDSWGPDASGKSFSVLSLGFGALYNHRDPGFNVAWGWLGGFGLVEMRASREIEEGEELFISYGPAYWRSRGKPRR